jgi:molecular chaperone GrpE
MSQSRKPRPKAANDPQVKEPHFGDTPAPQEPPSPPTAAEDPAAQTSQSQQPQVQPSQPAPEAQPAAPAPTPEDRIAAVEAEKTALRDQLLRALAETENVRKRGAKEREDALKYGATGFAKDILAVADNLRRALEALPKDKLEQDETIKTFALGVELTEKELLAAFERHGIKRIDPQGQKFDPNLHQAMMQVPNSGQPEGTVVQVMQVGYVIHDRLLRPAMVGVAKAPDQQAPSGPQVDTTA